MDLAGSSTRPDHQHDAVTCEEDDTMSTQLLPRRTAHQSPFTEVREARTQRALVATATLTGILSVTAATLAAISIWLGA
jgi:hypothetical protein